MKNVKGLMGALGFLCIMMGLNSSAYANTSSSAISKITHSERVAIADTRLTQGAGVIDEIADTRLTQGAGVIDEIADTRLTQGVGVIDEIADTRLTQGAGVIDEIADTRLTQGAGAIDEIADTRLTETEQGILLDEVGLTGLGTVFS